MGRSKNIMVSIVIPVYQVKDTLRRCVLSCLDQKGIGQEEIEVILVDDGSTDGSSEICDELLRQDELKRIRVYHGRNFGVSHARNTGIDMAEGMYIAFVDSDDTVTDTFVSNMLKYADDGTVLVDGSGYFVSAKKLTGFQYIEKSILNRNPHVWGKLFNRKSITDQDIRFDEKLTIGEDLIFLIDYAINQGRDHTIRCIEERDYNYIDNGEGAMNSSFKESYMDQFTCWKMADDRLKPYEREISSYAFVSLSVSRVMTALLVVGKIAVVDEKNRDRNITEKVISLAGDNIKEALRRKGVFAGLSAGYKIKVMLFRISPKLYLDLYHRHKRG